MLTLGMACCVVQALLHVAWSKPVEHKLEVVAHEGYVDRVDDVDATAPHVSKATVDTIWIADWTFDGPGGACDDSGWDRRDLRKPESWLDTGDEVLWEVSPGFDGQGGIVGQAAVCGGNPDPCCAVRDGYGNSWHQAIRIQYAGASFLSFDYLLDSEPDYDFLIVEVDSACASSAIVDADGDGSIDDPETRVWRGENGFRSSYTVHHRRQLLEDSGYRLNGRVDSLPLPDFGTTETHCLYIVFFSDGGWSPCDGLWPTSIGAGLVVDNLEISGGTTLTESFEAATDPRIAFLNFWDDLGLGQWGRMFPHVTDNDVCTENTTCAWLWTDDTTPTIATNPSMAFGPGAFVVRRFVDNVIVSPWVSLAGISPQRPLVVSWRQFGGTPWHTRTIVGQWIYRFKSRLEDTGSPSPGDSLDCVGRGATGWQLTGGSSWTGFAWRTLTRELASQVPVDAREVQIGFRVADAELYGGPPQAADLEPGPYIDRIRIGREAIAPGPVFDEGIDSRWQAQDAFPTEIHPHVTPAGEHHRPTTDRFGTAAFSFGFDLAQNTPGSLPPNSWNLITGDSITISVHDERVAGGITRVEWWGSIVAGPHAGKAPPPWTVGTNGFFTVPPDSVRDHWNGGVIVEDAWAIDLDDDYFRGGDVLHYFWLAQDALGGVSSSPEGLSELPGSHDEAERLTGGLWEVSFLPTIDWDPGYRARIAADPHGKLEPTEAELVNSTQANSILYFQMLDRRRLSGDTNRTSFMYTLDRLGYRDHYDVYDIQGLGNTHNQLAGRATVEQATGYALIIQDVGQVAESSSPEIYLPDGSDILFAKIDQATWYRDWLANAASSDVGTATLWLIGSRLTEIGHENPLFGVDMGVGLAAADVLPTVGVNPNVDGQCSFTFANGSVADFSQDQFSIEAGCPTFPAYNGIDASGSSVVTHAWAQQLGAVVMNANPSESWNTILQVPTWETMHVSASESSSPEADLMAKILGGVLPPDRIQHPDPTTDVRDDADELDALPKVTALYQNAPNPFNPMTTIRFDLARDGRVELRVYDVSGRLVRTLVNRSMARQRHEVVWDGMDNAGIRVSSGIYFYRLEAAGFRDTHKMIVLR